LPRPVDPNVLVGFHTNDDAGVYLLADDLALVQTVDFFTPIVDDPHTFGQIAAANALSDIYAMGGRPVSALSIVGYPDKGDPAILEAILRGGMAKMEEARCSVVGGHSIRNDDIQFGYAVSGVIHPKAIWRNVGARPGDALLLTKAIGTGILATALKKNELAQEALDASVASMTQLNRAAAEALHQLESRPGASRVVHAVTDVTGFGLLGHAREMALGDAAAGIEAVSFEIDHTAVPYLPGAVEAADLGHLPGGLKNNRDFVRSCVGFDAAVPQPYRDLAFDPQTSGGLLIAIAPDAAEAALAALSESGVRAQRIGTVTEKRSPMLLVR
jgi:selenide,water dikinase